MAEPNFILNKLAAAGCTAAGAAAIAANIQAESAFIENNVEDRCPVSDADYTARTDNGSYGGFVHDSYGYGLCQWTFHSRKAALLAFAKSTGRSIGDAAMQLEFLVKELKSDYPALWNRLCSSEELAALTVEFMVSFEAPADRSDGAKNYRVKLARMLLENAEKVNAEKEAPAYPRFCEVSLPELWMGLRGEAVCTMQTLLNLHGAALETDGIFGGLSLAAVRDFQEKCSLAPDGICGRETWKTLIGS